MTTDAFQQRLSGALALAAFSQVVARTPERISAADDEVRWLQEYLLFTGDGRFRDALVYLEQGWHRELTEWGRAAVLIKRRVDRNVVTGATTSGDLWVVALAPSPFGALWDTAETDLAQAESLHPVHAFFLTVAAERAELWASRSALRKERQALGEQTDAELERDYLSIRGYTARRVLREARLLTAVEANRADEAKLAQVKARLQQGCREAKARRDARLEEIATALDALDARLALLAEGEGAPTFAPPDQEEGGSLPLLLAA